METLLTKRNFPGFNWFVRPLIKPLVSDLYQKAVDKAVAYTVFFLYMNLFLYAVRICYIGYELL